MMKLDIYYIFFPSWTLQTILDKLFLYNAVFVTSKSDISNRSNECVKFVWDTVLLT